MRRRALRRAQLRKVQDIARIYKERAREEPNTEYAVTDVALAVLASTDGPRLQWTSSEWLLTVGRLIQAYALLNVPTSRREAHDHGWAQQRQLG